MEHAWLGYIFDADVASPVVDRGQHQTPPIGGGERAAASRGRNATTRSHAWPARDRLAATDSEADSTRNRLSPGRRSDGGGISTRTPPPACVNLFYTVIRCTSS